MFIITVPIESFKDMQESTRLVEKTEMEMSPVYTGLSIRKVKLA